jgi:hypothetical protein
MRRFFQSDAIGRPQFVAAGLLLVYLLQCLWLVRVQSLQDAGPDSDLVFRVNVGLHQWKSGVVTGPPQYSRPEPVLPLGSRSGSSVDAYGQYLPLLYYRSPLYYLIAAVPFVAHPASWTAGSPWWQVLAVLPYLFFGVMLGGSLWYVTRRLYGNAGGYIALSLYCFSPAMIRATGPGNLAEIGGVWGAFGAIWTAIAVAHTLYAPREVVLWNWRRILLLGLSMALAIGNQFSMAFMAGGALLMMLWVAPVRKRAVLAIWMASVGVAVALLFASYFFHPRPFWQGMKRARWFEFDPHSLGASITYVHILQAISLASPALIAALPAAVVVFFVWKRARYFGNTAPLLIAAMLLVLGAGTHFPGQGFELAGVVFLFVFVSGVFADLRETRRGLLVMAALGGLLIATAAWNVISLAQAARP